MPKQIGRFCPSTIHICLIQSSHRPTFVISFTHDTCACMYSQIFGISNLKEELFPLTSGKICIHIRFIGLFQNLLAKTDQILSRLFLPVYGLFHTQLYQHENSVVDMKSIITLVKIISFLSCHVLVYRPRVPLRHIIVTTIV